MEDFMGEAVGSIGHLLVTAIGVLSGLAGLYVTVPHILGSFRKRTKKAFNEEIDKRRLETRELGELTTDPSKLLAFSLSRASFLAAILFTLLFLEYVLNIVTLEQSIFYQGPLGIVGIVYSYWWHKSIDEARDIKKYREKIARKMFKKFSDVVLREGITEDDINNMLNRVS